MEEEHGFDGFVRIITDEEFVDLLNGVETILKNPFKSVPIAIAIGIRQICVPLP